MDGLADKFMAGLHADIKWTFDADRTLIIEQPATHAEKQRLTARLNARFPAGRVTVA